MEIKKTNFLLALAYLHLQTFDLSAQTEVISMPDDDVLNTCDLIVNSDNGGLAPYSASQNNVLTVCPVAPEVQVNLYFLDFDLSPGDTMFIYNGPDVSAPLITSNSLGDLQFQTISPDLTTNPDGCLTVNFISNADSELGAYNFRVTCGVPCLYPLANIEAGGDTLKICPGETVSFDASGSTAGDGITPITNPDIVSWTIGTIDSSIWPVFTYQFNEPGGYRVRLNLTDANGCNSINLPEVIVLVSTPYLFDISTTSDYFCVGNEVLIGTTAFVDSTSEFNDENQNGEAVTWVEDQSVVFENGNYIPDNQGCLYAEINFNSFDNGDTISSPSDFNQIYFNIEHSYVGDILINVICPDGSVMGIFPAEAGSSSYLGEPIDIDDGVPGVGYTYSFTPNSTGGTWVDYINSGGASPIPAGEYLPEGTFDDLIGCPLNGTWQLEVCDVVGADDGWVFEFGVAFNASFYPDVLTFTPIIGSGCDSSYWVNPEQFTQVGGNCDWAIFTPTEPGVYEFFYKVINDFGCSYNDSLSIMVRSPELNADSLITCGDIVPTNVTVLDADQSDMLFSWSPGTFLSATNELSPDVINFSGEPIDYVVTVNITTLQNCVDTAIVHVEYGGSVDLGEPEQFDCDVTMPHEVVASPAGLGNYTYQWFPPNQSFPSSTNDTIVVNVDGIYRLIATAPCNIDTLDYHIAPPLPLMSDTLSPCLQDLPTSIVTEYIGQQVDWVWNYYATDSNYLNNMPDLAAFATTPGLDEVENGGYYVATVQQSYCTESRDYLFHLIPVNCIDCGGAGIAGCTDFNACNYVLAAACDDSSCTYPGCTDFTAINYEPEAGCDDGSCYYNATVGCMNVLACNYNPTATISDSLVCTFPGCIDNVACNYNPEAGCADNSCEYAGCGLTSACNYDAQAFCFDNTLCVLPQYFLDCSGNCLNDVNGNGVCDEIEALGCNDPLSCNYTPLDITPDDNVCYYPGCTQPLACNFSANAACDDPQNPCTFPGCDIPGACNYIANVGCNDGSCTFPGCMDIEACNYNPFAGCGNIEDECDQPGDACDDGNVNTANDVINNSCACVSCAFAAPVILGPTSVASNSVQTYSITTLANVTYNWEVTGGNIIGNQNTNAIQVQWGVVNAAIVSVTIEAVDGSCLQVASLQIVSGVEKLDANDITLFPNPAQQYIQIGYSDSRPETIEFMNILGEQLYSGTFKSQLDVSRFANGMYVLRIWRNGVAETRMFEVQH